MIFAVGIAMQNPTPDGTGTTCPSNSSSTRSEIQSMRAGSSAKWSGLLLGSEYTLELFDQAVVEEMELSSLSGARSFGIRLEGRMVSEFSRITAS